MPNRKTKATKSNKKKTGNNQKAEETVTGPLDTLMATSTTTDNTNSSGNNNNNNTRKRKPVKRTFTELKEEDAEKGDSPDLEVVEADKKRIKQEILVCPKLSSNTTSDLTHHLGKPDERTFLNMHPKPAFCKIE